MKIDKGLFEFGRRKVADFVSVTPFCAPLDPDVRRKVYLNDVGSEVHVQGENIARVSKTESLAEKIARFDRLAAYVRQSRAAQMLLSSDFEDGDGYTDEELNDDSFADEQDPFDEFGEPIEQLVQKTVVKPQDAAASAGKPTAPQKAESASEQEADAS